MTILIIIFIIGSAVSLKEGRRLGRILPVIATPLVFGVALSGGAESKPEAFLVRRPAVVATVPEATAPRLDLIRETIVFPGSKSVEMPTILPIEVPTVRQIKKFLPKSLHPEFLYENDEQKKKDIPSFMTISPVIFTGVISSDPGNDEAYESPPGVGQKYLGFRSTQKDPRTGEYLSFWLSFSNYKPEDLAPLLEFEKNNSPKDRYRIRFPVSPHEEYRQATQVAYQHSRGLTSSEAADYEKQCLEGAWDFVDNPFADNYFTTFSIDAISKV